MKKYRYLRILYSETDICQFIIIHLFRNKNDLEERKNTKLKSFNINLVYFVRFSLNAAYNQRFKRTIQNCTWKLTYK